MKMQEGVDGIGSSDDVPGNAKNTARRFRNPSGRLSGKVVNAAKNGKRAGKTYLEPWGINSHGVRPACEGRGFTTHVQHGTVQSIFLRYCFTLITS